MQFVQDNDPDLLVMLLCHTYKPQLCGVAQIGIIAGRERKSHLNKQIHFTSILIFHVNISKKHNGLSKR